MVSISFEKLTLSNGLDVILHEDHSLPVVAVNVWYHVGSKNEEVGRTGFAHLFEHVMFEGSKHHNKSYFEPLQKVGANLNGSTTPDRTNYWENVPSNYLELALWLESDRMGFLLDALDQKRFEIQRDVVKNERRQSYENRPYGMANMLLQPAVFPAPHPYNWTTIGSMEDLDAAELDDIKAFFRKYYAPSNASLAIVGDFNPDDVKQMVERYFGDLPPGAAINRVGRMDSELGGQVSLTMRDKVQLPRLYLVWPTVPQFSVGQPPLDILSIILGDGKSSRLYRSLVYEKQIARDVGILHYGQEISGEFHMQITANPGHSLDEIESVVWEEVERMKHKPPTDRELTRAKNRIESQHVRQLERFGGFGGRADQLNYYNTMTGDPNSINTDLDLYTSVTAEDVRQAAKSSLSEKFVRLSVLPELSLSVSSGTIDRSAMPDAADSPTFSPPVPSRATLSNGLNIVWVEKPGLPMVSFALVIRAGAITDPADKPGLAHLTANMLQEGTPNRTSQQIADDMEFLGTHISIEAQREYTTLSASTLSARWRETLEITSDIVQNPTFPDDELERVRKERLTELKRIVDNPNLISMRASRALLYGPDTQYGHPITGRESSVESVTRDDLTAHYANHYGPENATLIIVGDITESEVMSIAEERFGSWASNGSKAAQTVEDVHIGAPTPTTIYLADKPGAAQSIIRAGHTTIQRNSPDFFKLNLLNYIFGGQFTARLNQNLRQDKGYSYGYNSSIDWLNAPSAWFAGGGVETDVTKESIIETLKEFADIRGARPVEQSEFTAARDGILQGLPSQFETQTQILQQLIRLVVFNLPDDYFVNYVDNMNANTLEDVQRIAKERLDDSHLKVLVVGDRAEIEPGLKELGLPIVHIDYEGRPVQQE